MLSILADKDTFINVHFTSFLQVHLIREIFFLKILSKLNKDFFFRKDFSIIVIIITTKIFLKNKFLQFFVILLKFFKRLFIWRSTLWYASGVWLVTPPGGS